MIEDKRLFTTEFAVIGSGLTGMAAAIFAINRGISTSLAGNTGAIAYTTGYLDLLGKADSNSPLSNDPWHALASLRSSQPRHPLSRVSDEEIRAGFDEFTAFIGSCGIKYGTPQERNVMALTPAGTSKPTFSVPATMQAGVEAFAAKSKCTIVDFKGLRGFSARQCVANLQKEWPLLKARRVTFPNMEHGEIYAEVMARALEVPANREALAEEIKKVAGDSEVIGMPAVLGMHKPDQVMADLARLIGVPIFEIPTMPPSVPGIRLREMFEQVFPEKGLTLVPQQKVTNVEFGRDGITLSLRDNFGPIDIVAKTVLLATGRFLSGGLQAHHDGITEPLLGLHVNQPENRDDWYSHNYLDKAGHSIHLSGIEVDDQFHPIDADGKVIDQRLFAAGVILAHQDWIRGRCGAGVALATAYRAVNEAHKLLKAA
ncbi:glycerol-3-phosphate dehydrogenase subunit GlpB [Desulfosediminicola sp.]|uniref:glycerol-3-phosphate dehydrogenase subunit GlpB n=1 Tax=Desulfosediminicola sp. TaxID=2886825 RepID=UPI003AF25119